MKINLEQFNDNNLNQLVDARWKSSEDLWETIDRVYKQNTAVYENKTDWVNYIPQRRRQFRVQANRVFVNMEAVINSIIANPPGINVLPARDGEIAQDFARKLETYLRKKYTERNIKETYRMAFRNLYFGRLFVIKAFWNPIINDFDFRSVDPRKLRVSKFARKEQDSEFAIEEIGDNLCSVIERFPKKKQELMQKFGITDETQLYIKNPDVTYKEAWIQDYVIFKLDNIILDKIKNPYWDWEGIFITEEEEQQLLELEGPGRREFLQNIKLQQDQRKMEMEMASPQQDTTADNPTQPQPDPNNPMGAAPYKKFHFNFFENPRKPYIYATIFNNENSPIGRADMIGLSAELQRGIDKRKMDIDENCDMVNGLLKIDSSVMPKADAQRIRFETKGIIWGKGVKDGVIRETGMALPQMVFDDMIDSRQEIDNIMAASSAFRGERQGQETKAGRLALIQQSYLRLNEMVQVFDFVAQETFSWGLQLAKTRYTEYHSAEWVNKEGEREAIELIQDDFEAGNKITIIAGKSLPVDNEFKFEQAQNDVKDGFISPVDYLDIAQYDNAKELSKNAVVYKLNPVHAVGIPPDEAAQIAPPQTAEEKPPSISINYADVQPDGQVQIMQKIGVQVDPQITVAEKMAEREKGKQEMDMKREQGMAKLQQKEPKPKEK